MLPCEPEHFRDFIAGLLGRPQTITRYLPGPYEVNRTDIESLYHLVDQRVSSQNDATLIQFTARIVYDDDSSVLLNSFTDFMHYNEVKPLISTDVHLGWTFLIKFRNKDFPEKQQIDVSFTTDNSQLLTKKRAREFGAYGLSEFVPYVMRRVLNSISIRISHTDRTWGTDIEALLSGQLQHLKKKDRPLKAFAYDHSGVLSLFVGSGVFISALVAGFFITDTFIERYLAAAKILGSNTSLNFDSLVKKIDFLMNIIASGLWTRYAFYVSGFFILAIIVAIFLAIIVSSYAETRRPSFVVLTKEAQENRDEATKRYESNWWKLTGSIIGSLIISVFGNYLFYKIMQYWAPQQILP